jgi:flagellin-like protein
MKGISPVVAEVLLIAIVITTSVGIWYWMGSFTQVPVSNVDYISIVVTNCNGTHALVRNVGIEDAISPADIFKKDVGLEGYLDLNNSNMLLRSGNSTYVRIVPSGGTPYLFNGTFIILDRDYQDYTFVC